MRAWARIKYSSLHFAGQSCARSARLLRGFSPWAFSGPRGGQDVADVPARSDGIKKPRAHKQDHSFAKGMQ